MITGLQLSLAVTPIFVQEAVLSRQLKLLRDNRGERRSKLWDLNISNNIHHSQLGALITCA